LVLAWKKKTARKHRNHSRHAARRRAATGRLGMAFEIYDTPVELNRTEDVQELAERAYDLLAHKDGPGAEIVLKQALKMEPDACDLRNNLCAAYEMQGRRGEAEALVREIHERNPHYFFGRTNLAQLCIKEGNLERAGRLLEPLLKQRRMHVTEFSALAGAQIHFHLASGDVDRARSWFKIWTETAPGHPLQKQWRRDLAPTPLGWLRRQAIRRRHLQ
jgi:tetratricopeptide (TPR) repeat protein